MRFRSIGRQWGGCLTVRDSRAESGMQGEAQGIGTLAHARIGARGLRLL